MEVNKVLLSLGSNLGDRFSNLQLAVNELEKLGEISKCSSIYETPPWGFDAASSFYNICLEFSTELSPQDLLIKNQAIERKMGRVKGSGLGYESRIIDIDILFFGKQLIFSNSLQIPHPEYEKRDFVLFPLFEIAPEWQDPITGKKINEIMKNRENVTTIKPIKQQIVINK